MTGKIDALLTTGIRSVAKQLCGIPAATTLNQSTQSRAPITSSGYLHTAFNPQNTRITIDGDIVANNSTTMLNTGRYILTAKLTNYYLVNRTITINRNDTTYINQTLKYGLDDYKKIQKNKKKGFYGVVVSTSITAISYFITGMLYNKYVDAEAEQDATDFRNKTELFHTMSNISGLITASVWGYSLYNYKTEKSLKKKIDLNE
tara:strand:- start:95 stop:706 length:612 start_codon:yes stop_codon:yes gene_type:complete